MGVLFLKIIFTPLCLAKQTVWWACDVDIWVYSSNKENWLMGIFLWFSRENMIYERAKEREEFMLTLFAGFIFLCNK